MFSQTQTSTESKNKNRNERKLDLVARPLSAEALIYIRDKRLAADTALIKRALRGELTYELTDSVIKEAPTLAPHTKAKIENELFKAISGSKELNKRYAVLEDEARLENSINSFWSPGLGKALFIFLLLIVSIGWALELLPLINMYTIITVLMTALPLACAGVYVHNYRETLSATLEKKKEKRKREERSELELERKESLALEAKQKQAKQARERLLAQFLSAFNIDEAQISNGQLDFKNNTVIKVKDKHIILTPQLLELIHPHLTRLFTDISVLNNQSQRITASSFNAKLTKTEFDTLLSALIKQLSENSLEAQIQQVKDNCQQMLDMLLSRKAFSFALPENLPKLESCVATDPKHIRMAKENYNEKLRDYLNYVAKISALNASTETHFAEMSSHQQTLSQIKDELELLSKGEIDAGVTTKIESANARIRSVSRVVDELSAAKKEHENYNRKLKPLSDHVAHARKKLDETVSSSSPQLTVPTPVYVKQVNVTREEKPKRREEEKAAALQRIREQKEEKRKEEEKQRQAEKEKLEKSESAKKSVQHSMALSDEKTLISKLISEIKKDGCFNLAKEQLSLLSNVINNACGTLNPASIDPTLYKKIQFHALLYSLMKCSFALFEMVEDGRYKKLIWFENLVALEQIKNNLIHHFYILDADDERLFKLGEAFLHLFRKPLDEIQRVIDNPDEHFTPASIVIQFSQSLTIFYRPIHVDKKSKDDILARLNSVFEDLTHFWELGTRLHEEHKYDHAGALHAAIKAKIFMAREFLNMLRDNGHAQLYQQIIKKLDRHYPELGNKISHHMSEEDDREHKHRKLEGREYAHFEEFGALQLLHFAKVNPKVFSLLKPSLAVTDFLNRSLPPEPSPDTNRETKSKAPATAWKK